jgi:hypothetical protein
MNSFHFIEGRNNMCVCVYVCVGVRVRVRVRASERAG